MMMYGWIIGLIFLVILIVGINRWSGVFQKNNADVSNQNSESSPLEVLKRRFAEGEIDKDEFNKKKAELKD